MQTSGAAVVVNATMNLVLVRVLGYRGLALGTSIAALFNAGALLWLLRRRLDGLDGRRIAGSLVRITAASLVMAAVAWTVDRTLVDVIPGAAFAAQALRLLLTIVAALSALAAAASALRIDELRQVVLAVFASPRGGIRPGVPPSTS